MKVKNKTIVVTGGGNGIGREIVLGLLNKGAKVAAIDMRESSLAETQSLAGKNAVNLYTYALDITNKEAVEKLPEQVRAKQGSADGIINCAGIIQPFVRVNELDFASIERVMQVNFFGTLYMVKAFLPHFLKLSEAHILNVSSMGGFLPVPGQTIYGASKAAVKLLTEGLYSELLYTAVKVSLVFPGAIGTNISDNSGVAAPKISEDNLKKSSIKMLAPSKAADLIINGMENDKLRIYVGNDSKILNFLYRLNPGFATRFIAKQMKELLPK